MERHRRGEKVITSLVATSPRARTKRGQRQRRVALRARTNVLERAVGQALYRGDLEKAGYLVALRRELLRRLGRR